jgi:hypothetical protein
LVRHDENDETLCVIILLYRHLDSDKFHSSFGIETFPSLLSLLSGISAEKQFATYFLSTNCLWSQAFAAEMEIRYSG